MTGRIADLPLEERQAREAANLREIQEGLVRSHLATAGYEHAYAAVQFARLLRMGRTRRG